MDSSRLAARLTRGFLPPQTPFARLTESGKILTNADFLRAAACWTQAFLRARPSGPCRAAVFTEDTVEFAALAYGAWRAGVETLLLADALPAGTAKLAETGLIHLTAGACRAPGIPHVTPDAEAVIPLETDAPLPEGDVLVSLLTSGSTGEPKRIPKRLDQLFHEVEGLDRSLGKLGLAADALREKGAQLTVYSTVTHQHIYGILFRVLWPMLGGGLLTDTRLHYPEVLARAMAAAADSPLAVISSPAHYRRLDDPSLFDDGIRSRIALTVSSAGPLDDEAAKKAFAAFGCFPMELLGSTETGGIARRTRAYSGNALETPPWRPIPSVEIGIVPEAPEADAPGEGAVRPLAELLADPETVFPLRGTIALKSRQLAGEGFEVGSDTILLSTDGSFTLMGRADRIVKVEGKRVSLAAVEKHLQDSPFVTSAKVFLRTANREALAAVAEVTSEGAALLIEKGKAELVSALRRTLAPYLDPVTVPKHWRFVDKLPANAQGKTTLASLQALFDPRRPQWLTLSSQGEAGSRRTVLQCTLTRQLAWFEGHFPGIPILPGVAQLRIASEEVRARFGIEKNPASVKNLKFKAITSPGMTMRLTLEERGPRDIAFLWQRVDEEGVLHVHAQGVFHYED